MSSEIEVRLVERDGTRITDLPDAVVTDASWVLNAEGSMSFNMDPFGVGADKIKLWDTEVQVWWDGWLGWWGVPWSCRGPSSSLSFQCKSIISLLYKRYVDRMTLIYGDASADPVVTIDQFTIGMNLIDYAQDESFQPFRDLNIQAAAFLPSGVGRTEVYKRDEHKNILDLLKQFPTRFNGFDWDLDITGDGGRFWHPYYPKKGQLQENLSIEWHSAGSRNCENFDYAEDFANGCTQAYATGGSVNNQKIEENFEDDDASELHGVMQMIVSEGSTLDRPTLLNRATKEVALRKDPVITPAVTSAFNVNIPVLGILEVGDWIPVLIDNGRQQVAANHRVESIQWHADDTVNFDFAEVVA